MSQIILFCLTKNIGDWTIRIDNAHGNVPNSQKHIHISKKKLAGIYSWNVDGSRHDAHKFPHSEQCIEAAKKHASKELGIPVSSFSILCALNGGNRISLRSNLAKEYGKMPLFNSYVSKKITLIFLGTPSGLVLVLDKSSD